MLKMSVSLLHFFFIQNTNSRNTKDKYTNKTRTTIEQDKIQETKTTIEQDKKSFNDWNTKTKHKHSHTQSQLRYHKGKIIIIIGTALSPNKKENNRETDNGTVKRP
jgi:hypothetical protein